MAIFYPLSAVVNLFCGILLDPTDRQMQEDIKLIQSMPQLARDMRSYCLTTQDDKFFRALDRFVSELVRLAHLAVARSGAA